MRFHIFALIAVCSVFVQTTGVCAGTVGPFAFMAEGITTVDFDFETFENISTVISQSPDFGLEMFSAEGSAVFQKNVVMTEGTFVVSGSLGALSADFYGLIFIDENGNGAGAGEFTINPALGTGIFEHLSGSGVFTSLNQPFDDYNQAFTVLAFKGRLVPAPGALSALGAAGLLGVRRRRRQ